MPHALWSARAADFQVAGHLTVQGTSTFSGNATFSQPVSVGTVDFGAGQGSMTRFTTTPIVAANGGQTFLAPSGIAFCFLTSMELFQDGPFGGAGAGRCAVSEQGGGWILFADRANCAAQCIQFGGP